MISAPAPEYILSALGPNVIVSIPLPPLTVHLKLSSLVASNVEAAVAPGLTLIL